MKILKKLLLLLVILIPFMWSIPCWAEQCVTPDGRIAEVNCADDNPIGPCSDLVLRHVSKLDNYVFKFEDHTLYFSKKDNYNMIINGHKNYNWDDAIPGSLLKEFMKEIISDW